MDYALVVYKDLHLIFNLTNNCAIVKQKEKETAMGLNAKSLEDLTYSGYDLLDKLSRRRQYVRSHAREKTCLIGFEPVQSYSDGDVDDLKISGLGLMEKTSFDVRKSRNMSWYEDTRTPFKHNADYLKRLSSLRDSLIDQEQTNLAHALERLRAKQSNRELQMKKQKVRHSLDNSDGNTKKFVTTIEKFKQSRPKKLSPELHPLEGKQLIEPQVSRTPQLSEKSGSATSVTRSVEENIIRTNLQRLIAPITPTSSIPNIGRKSQKSMQQLVLDTSPIQRKKSCLSADNIDKNPFKHVHRGARVRKAIRPELDELELTPQAVKFDKFGDRDKLNMDKLKEYYCIYYLPSNTPTGQEELVSDNDSVHSMDENRNKKSENDKQISRDSKLDENSEPFTYSSEEYRYKSGYFGASQRVPEKKPTIHPVTGKAMVTNTDDIRKHRLRKLHLSNSVNNPDEEHNILIDGKEPNNRKQIVVDMPSIVFNAPTPEVTDLELRSTLLAKAYKQNELRQKELKNLMEDVRELNKRSDDLSEHFPTQSPSN